MENIVVVLACFTKGLDPASEYVLKTWAKARVLSIIRSRCGYSSGVCVWLCKVYKYRREHVLINESGGGKPVKHYADTPIAAEGKRVWATSGAF